MATVVALNAFSMGAAFSRTSVTATPSKILALQQLWVTLPASMLTGDKLNAVNSKMVPGPSVDIQRSEIKKILAGSGDLAIMTAYATNPPQPVNATTLAAVNYLLAIVGYEASYSATLQTSNPVYAAAIEGFAPSLLAAGVSQAAIDAMLALIQPLVPWWKMNGFSAPVNVYDLISGGNLY